MALTRQECSEALANANVRAFLRIIREGESGQTDDAYRIINGGALFEVPPWEHPWPDGTPTTRGGKAAGAFQFLPSTWKRVADALGLPDFSPPNQDTGAVYLIDGRGALPAVLSGDLTKACSLLKDEWVSLPNLGLQRIQRVFLHYGGTLTPGAEVPQSPPPRPLEAPTGDVIALDVPTPPTGGKMPIPILGLISVVGPILAQLIPQIGAILQPKSEVAQRNVKLVETAFKTITEVAGAANIVEATEKMQSDAALLERVKAAVITQPEIIGFMEVGAGGIAGAREASIVMQNAERPYWYNPAFAISVLLFTLPLLMMIDVLFVHPEGYIGELRTQIVTGVLAVIMLIGGFWLGSSMGSQRKTEIAAEGLPSK